jgi:hypothetical protein
MASSPYTLLGNPIPGPTAQTVVIGDGTTYLEIDVCIKEKHKFPVDVTDHAVERGIAISDHARPKPEEITLEGMVTNNPTTTGTTPRRADTARQFFHGLHDHPRLVSVIMPSWKYTDMILTELEEERDAKTGDVFMINATFKHVRQVTNQVTTVATKQPKTKPKTTNGAQTTFTPPAPKGTTAGITKFKTLTGSGGTSPAPAAPAGH